MTMRQERVRRFDPDTLIVGQRFPATMLRWVPVSGRLIVRSDHTAADANQR